MNTLLLRNIIGTFDATLEAHGPVVYGPGAKKLPKPYALRTLEAGEQEKIAKAKKYAMEQSIQSVLQKQAFGNQTVSIQNLMKQQTVSVVTRVYVGSINYDVTDWQIREHFICFGPIKNVSMSWDGGTARHKGFCFIEFEFPESAILAIEHMNNTNFGNRLMKVGRPSNLANPAPLIEQMMEENKLEKRIFVAGVHHGLNDTDIADVFSAFGKVLRCKLEVEVNDPNKHRGFGYIDYETEQCANDAVQNMNRFDLGGQLLKVTKAICPPEFIRSFQQEASRAQKVEYPAANGSSEPSITTIVTKRSQPDPPASDATAEAKTDGMQPPATLPAQGPLENDVEMDLGRSPSRVQTPPLTEPVASTMEAVPTSVPNEPSPAEAQEPPILPPECIGVLLLLNMVEPAEVDATLAMEVNEECSNYGIVRDVKIIPVGDEVRIFVHYSHPAAVLCARQGLDGRFFGGKAIRALAYDSQAFQRGDYTQQPCT